MNDNKSNQIVSADENRSDGDNSTEEYQAYENHQISAVDMHVENLDSDKMICYPVIQGERINYQNK